MGKARVLQKVSLESVTSRKSLLKPWLRLAYYVFEHDMRVATVFLRNPLTSFAEFTAALPCSAQLWEASSAESWRAIFLAEHGDGTNKGFEVSLRDLICRPRLLETIFTGVDIYRAKSLLLHGLAGQIFEFRKNAKIAAAAEAQPHASHELWLRMRQEDLYIAISPRYDAKLTEMPGTRILPHRPLLSKSTRQVRCSAIF
jgi:hypothetical protein